MERVGRVSDSALPAGTYANSYAAASATGIGEDIVDESLCSRLVIRAKDMNDLKASFLQTFKETALRRRKLAAIGLDQRETVIWNFTTGILYYAFKTSRASGRFSL